MSIASYVIAATTLVFAGLVLFWVMRADESERPKPSPERLRRATPAQVRRVQRREQPKLFCKLNGTAPSCSGPSKAPSRRIRPGAGGRVPGCKRGHPAAADRGGYSTGFSLLPSARAVRPIGVIVRRHCLP
jgi:hypothetical protein